MLLVRLRAEQGFAVAAAQQEGEPPQVVAQLSGVIGGVADEFFQQVRDLCCQSLARLALL